jgi:uncharacterized Zn-binding protein involved in type VI secretion
MSGIARAGDIAVGTCFAHKSPKSVQGVIGVGDPTVLSAGLPTAAVGDPVCFDCGHTGVIVTGTAICSLKGKPIAMIGSQVAGPMVATIVLGASTILGN